VPSWRGFNLGGEPLPATARLTFLVALPKQRRLKQLLASHHVEDPNPFPVEAIEDPAGGLDNLAVAGTTEFARDGPAFRVPFQLVDVFEYFLDQAVCCSGVIESDIVRDRVQIR
jgi:hypothetical protein